MSHVSTSKAPDFRRATVRMGQRGASLGFLTTHASQLIHKIERGFSFRTLRELESRSGMPVALIASLIGIPERTLARRKAAGRLAPQESERLLRVSIVFEKAVELFEGDTAKAVGWLTTPKKILGNQSPLEYSRTEPGAREVETIIGRLEHGVFS